MTGSSTDAERASLADPGPDAAIRVEGVSHAFGALPVLRGVSFAVRRGAVFGFVGPNGAGKTTTLRMMATLLEPDAGRVLVDGHDVVEAPEAVRRVLGFMPDGFGVYRNVTVDEYLAFFAAAHGLAPGARARAVAASVELTELGALRGRLVSTLSKGMTQRLAIARMLLHDPSVLVLDEPANGLDPRARIEMRRLLHTLRDLGKTIVLSSHILRELGDLVDEVVILERGRVVADGPVDRLLARLESGAAVRLRFLRPPGALVAALAALPRVSAVDPVGERELRVAHEGGEAAVAEIVAHAAALGAPPVRVEPEDADLERLFLSLTRGELQ